MYLTEAQKLQSEELFIALVESISNDHYDMDESYEMTEDDAYMTSILMDYFMENYQHLSLKESAYQALTGIDVNQELFDEIIEMMLDESVGTFVAGAAHGIKNLLAKQKGKQMLSQYQKSLINQKKLGSKLGVAKSVPASDTGSLSGKIKAGFQSAKVGGLSSRYEKSKGATQAAAQSSREAQGAMRKQSADTAGLASKIDTGITNVKNKFKSAVSSGAERLGSAAGRVAGAIA
jgi:hypothetical protein